MFDDKQLSKALDTSYKMLKRVTGRRELLPEPVRVAILIDAAQGIIDNGGLQYFFECNFADLTPYEEICNAYRAIGAEQAAERLEQAVAMFAFPEPHRDAAKRQEIMAALWEDDDSGFGDLDLRLCGDASVWECLNEYIQRHQQAFKRTR